MKHLLTLIFILSGFTQTYAQPEPAMLSIRRFGGNLDDVFRAAPTVTPDGGFMLSYNTVSTTGTINTTCGPTDRMIFQKYNADFTVLEWEKCDVPTVDSAFIYPFLQSDGSIIMGGERAGGTNDFKVRKVDAAGTIIWSRSYGGSAGEELRGMIATTDGGYILYGLTNSTDGDVGPHHGGGFSMDPWLLKVDGNGEKVWSKVYGGSLDEYLYSVIQGPANGYYIVGNTSSSDHDFAGAGYHGKGDAFVIRIDTDGKVIWSRCLGGSEEDGYLAAAHPDGKGGVVISSMTTSSDGDVINSGPGGDCWIIHLDSSSNTVWSNCFGRYEPRAVCMADDNTIWVVGSDDCRIAHIDNAGTLISERTLGSFSIRGEKFLYPLKGGTVLLGGMYDRTDAYLKKWEGGSDIFLAVFAPWTTSVPGTVGAEAKINIYPNPAQDYVTIKPASEINTIIVTDVAGRRVHHYSGQTNQDMQVNTSDWARGMYYVQVTGIDGNMAMAKLLLQ